MHEKGGINIRYRSRQDNGSIREVVYLTDLWYDAELTTLRRFAPVRFEPSGKSEWQMAGSLSSRLIKGGTGEATIAVYTPEDLTTHFNLEIKDARGKFISSQEFSREISSGSHSIMRAFELPEELKQEQVQRRGARY